MIYIPVPPWRRDFDCARDPYTARNALGITGTGIDAPANAEYITSSADATLTNERVLTNTASITWDFSTPGQAKANAVAGGGNVSNSGTPAAGQLARWVTSTTIEGVSLATAGIQPLDPTLTALAAFNTNGLLTQTAADTFTGRTLTGPAAGITISNGDGVAGNPTLALANDLAALEALSGTNTIYYRSGTDAWSGVTVGSGLSFAAGTLSATATAPTDPYHHGRLTYVSTTALKFAPFNGNKIKINGTIYTIPNAGIAGLTNTSAFVNGTGSSSLAANTTYYVYAFVNSGTVTGDFRTDGNGHITDTTSGNEGVEVRCSSGTTPDPTRTLIGFIRTTGSAQFVDSTGASSLRGVRSWFNRPAKLLDFGVASGATTTSTTPIATAMTGNFVLWSDEVFSVHFSGYTSNTNITANNVAIYLDGAQVTVASISIPGANYNQNGTVAYSGAPTEGFHTATVYVWTSAGTLGITGQFYGRLH